MKRNVFKALLITCILLSLNVYAKTVDYNIKDNILCNLPVENVTLNGGSIGNELQTYSDAGVLFDGEISISGLGGTRWAVEKYPNGAFVEFDFGRFVEFNKMTIVNGYMIGITNGVNDLERLKKFAIYYSDGTSWKQIPVDKNVDTDSEFVTIRFNTVSAKKFKIVSEQDAHFRIREVILMAGDKELQTDTTGYSYSYTPSRKIRIMHRTKEFGKSSFIPYSEGDLLTDNHSGTNLINIKAFEDVLGYTAKYDDERNRVIVMCGEKYLVFPIGEYYMLVDCVKCPMNAPTYKSENSSKVFVPIRTLVEQCGKYITWDSNERVITIFDDIYNLSETDKGVSPYKLRINDKNVQVFCANNNDFAQFTSDETVNVDLVYNGDVKTVDIRPQSKNIVYNIKEGHIYFKLNPGQYVSVEINGNLERPLFLFVNPTVKRPDENDKNVLFLDKEKVYKFRHLQLRDGMTVYIGDGVVVEGGFVGFHLNNIKIIGNGIVSSVGIGSVSCTMLEFSKDVTIRGPVFMQTGNWHHRWLGLDGVNASYCKMLGSETYSDGVDICGSSNVNMDNIFIRNVDDGFCLKTYEIAPNINNVNISNSVVWSGDQGNSFEIGYELRGGGKVSNINVKNIDVIHRQTRTAKFNRGAITLHLSGDTIIDGVTFDNFNVEESDENLIVMGYFHEKNWARSPIPSTRSRIKNITFKNFSLTGGKHNPPTWLYGIVRNHMGEIYSDESKFNLGLENIVFENMNYKGTKITSVDMAQKCGFIIDDKSTVDVKFK